MNTKQIIENIEKEFDERFHEIYAKETKKHIGGGEFYVNYIVDKNDEIKDFIRSYTRTLLEAFAEEVIGENETAVLVRKTPETDFFIDEIPASVESNLFRDMQRNKAKEIISSIEE